jgi:hypothetical protein
VRKSISFTNERYLKIERVAVELTAKTGKVKKWSDVVNYMVDQYLNDVKHDLMNESAQTKKM